MEQGVLSNNHLDAAVEALPSQLACLLGVKAGDVGQIKVGASLKLSIQGVYNCLFILFSHVKNFLSV
jgi:hypothetical protein